MANLEVFHIKLWRPRFLYAERVGAADLGASPLFFVFLHLALVLAPDK
jgi:hypothetical protein